MLLAVGTPQAPVTRPVYAIGGGYSATTAEQWRAGNSTRGGLLDDARHLVTQQLRDGVGQSSLLSGGTTVGDGPNDAAAPDLGPLCRMVGAGVQSIITTAEYGDGSVAYRAREQQDSSGQIVLTLTGEFDHESNAVLDGIVGRLTSGVAGDVVVDLTGVTFLNGHGLATMLHLQRSAEVRGRGLVVRCQAGTVCRLLGLIGLADAVQMIGSAPPIGAPALRLVAGDGQELGDRGPRRRYRPAGQLSRRWHHGES